MPSASTGAEHLARISHMPFVPEYLEQIDKPSDIAERCHLGISVPSERMVACCTVSVTLRPVIPMLTESRDGQEQPVWLERSNRQSRDSRRASDAFCFSLPMMKGSDFPCNFYSYADRRLIGFCELGQCLAKPRHCLHDDQELKADLHTVCIPSLLLLSVNSSSDCRRSGPISLKSSDPCCSILDVEESADAMRLS